MTFLLILGVLLVVGLALLASNRQASGPNLRRRRDHGGSGVWIDDVGPIGSLPFDRFGDGVGSPGSDDADFDPGGGSGGGGGASGSWDDGGSDGGGSDGGGGDGGGGGD